jgi:hypothetical protein
MYNDTLHAIGPVVNAIVGLVATVAALVFLGSLIRELCRRPRYSLRTILIAMTVFAALLGMAAISRH